MDPTPVYSGYSIFFGVIDRFDPPRAPLPPLPPEATRLQDMVDHPAAIIQVCVCDGCVCGAVGGEREEERVRRRLDSF